MATGFQHHQPVRNDGFFKPAPTPQHGGPADPKTADLKTAATAPREPRTFQLRPQY